MDPICILCTWQIRTQQTTQKTHRNEDQAKSSVHCSQGIHKLCNPRPMTTYKFAYGEHCMRPRSLLNQRFAAATRTELPANALFLFYLPVKNSCCTAYTESQLLHHEHTSVKTNAHKTFNTHKVSLCHGMHYRTRETRLPSNGTVVIFFTIVHRTEVEKAAAKVLTE